MIIVGLGNPGKEYQDNRHNIGFKVVDYFASKHSLVSTKKFNADCYYGNFLLDNGSSIKIICIKPGTFMNKSGNSVRPAVDFLKTQKVIVIHDELSLAEGIIQEKFGGGHSGHNGVRHIHSVLDFEYTRIRIGIGHPGSLVADYVLSDFKKDDFWVEKSIEDASTLIERYLNK
jgi:peptidyl-tRNA hydrolase, PTH1 family